MVSSQTITDTIKELASDGKSVGFKFDTLVVPLKLADKKALEILDMLNNDDELKDITFGDMHELLDLARFWVEFMQVVCYNDCPRTADVVFGTLEADE